jgi:predicted Fe-Mo cluster-binding NifX family protein
MKIAVATEYNNPAAEISTQGARALFFLIFNEDGQLNEILENPYAGNSHHVGLDVADMLSRLHVTKVVAGRFGPRFAAGLKTHNIDFIEQAGIAAPVAKELSV